MPYSPMHKHCIQMKDHKGKTTGLMMEGSAMHMSMLHQESAEQEKKDLMQDMPVDDKASAIEMSPYKMGHESPAEFTGMSGGSALHQEGDPDLSDMANLLFGEKKITKKQAKKAKEQVLSNPMAKDTLKPKPENNKGYTVENTTKKGLYK